MKLYWLALLLLVLAAFFYFWAKHTHKQSGLPGGKIVYSDMGAWEATEETFFDPRLYLTGKPDYVIRQGHMLIPVEVKTGRTPLEPYDSHIFQLAAYCYLIDQATGLRPPYGVLHYPKQTFKIDFTEDMEALLLNLIADMREVERRKGEVSRSHNEVRRCSGCGYRDACQERLR